MTGKDHELETPDRISVRQSEDGEAYLILKIPVEARDKSCQPGKKPTKCSGESSGGTQVKLREERFRKVFW